MFDLRLRYSDVGLRQVVRQLAGLALLVVLIGLISALAFSMPEVTAEISDNRQYARVVSVREYPDVSPTAHYSTLTP